MNTSELKTAALAYAERGWAVLPLYSIVDGACDCFKGAECSSPGKHPRIANWTKDATTGPATIRRWWEMWPSANIGGVVPDGYIVLDPDREADLAALLPLLGSFEAAPSPFIGAISSTLTALTGGGGLHLWYQLEDQSNLNCPPFPHVDLRKAGSHSVVFPPSMHAS